MSITATEERCRARWAVAPDATWAWHCHHGRLCEPLTAPPTDRIDLIRDNKPKAERERRFDLFAPLAAADLPPRLAKAWRASDEARQAYDEARQASEEALRVYEEALRAYDKAARAYDKAARAYVEALRACEEAQQASDEARRAYVEARQAYGAAWTQAQPELEALHKRLCRPDCTWDGKTIFPEKEGY